MHLSCGPDSRQLALTTASGVIEVWHWRDEQFQLRGRAYQPDAREAVLFTQSLPPV